jgi:hypothetical protein
MFVVFAVSVVYFGLAFLCRFVHSICDRIS